MNNCKNVKCIKNNGFCDCSTKYNDYYNYDFKNKSGSESSKSLSCATSYSAKTQSDDDSLSCVSSDLYSDNIPYDYCPPSSPIHNPIPDCSSEQSNDLINFIDLIDLQIENNTDFIQNQINILNKSYAEIINELKQGSNNYLTVINEITNINDTIDELKLNIYNCCNPKTDTCCKCENGKIVYTDITKTHIFVIDFDITCIFITMVGGGGAGGVGCVKGMYYYSGGGGGSGGALIRRPIQVTKGTIINITVGKGSDIRFDNFGGNTTVELVYPNGDKETIVVYGGENGKPVCDDTENPPNVTGGKGGEGISCNLKGCDGDDGTISLPSYISANGGNGGSSIFFKGGNGGSSYFTIGGKGGDIDNLLGSNGYLGSGGGGSCPKSIIDITTRISGLGGDGIVIIEW